jgi:hypothetical protein
VVANGVAAGLVFVASTIAVVYNLIRYGTTCSGRDEAKLLCLAVMGVGAAPIIPAKRVPSSSRRWSSPTLFIAPVALAEHCGETNLLFSQIAIGRYVHQSKNRTSIPRLHFHTGAGVRIKSWRRLTPIVIF